MAVLVFGQTGQVAQELGRHPGIVSLGRHAADLTDPSACGDAIRAARPSAVINAAAYTAVDKAETEEQLATTINAHAPAAMAAACAELGIPLIQISSDYVFDGSGDAPRHPNEPANPRNAYGRSKLAGEIAVRDSGAAHVILRTSWVVSAHGANFVKTMLRLGAERDGLRIVADQIGGPTPARDIADACMAMVGQLTRDPSKSGTYHFAGSPDVSWAEFARAIFELSGLDCTVTPIPTADYPTPTPRPLNSRLDCAATTSSFSIARPDWRTGLRQILLDLKAMK